ncbi:hypothetical protein I6I57_13690 [Brevibacterium casei]|nr:hypothetical protein I6I57_13690 [Brevibacterium casei]
MIIAAAFGGLLLVLTIAVGIYGLIIGPPDRDTDAPGSPAPTGESPRPPATVAQIPETTDGEEFATAVAHGLFTWDTHTVLTVEDYRQPLLEVTDPTGHETNGLVADLEDYLPNRETWIALQEYQTRQWLSVDDVFVPAQWEEAVEVGGDAIAEGTVAYTVTGTRHREGVWHGREETSQHEVAFTLFITCPPEGEACHLLRLSLLDEPLQ